MKNYYVNFAVNGHFIAVVNAEPSDTLETILQKGMNTYYDADFGDLDDNWIEQTSVYNENDHWYMECGDLKVSEDKPLGYQGKVFVDYQIIGRYEAAVKGGNNDTLTAIMDKANDMYMSADFHDLSDIDGKAVTVEDDDGNWYNGEEDDNTLDDEDLA